MQSSPSHEFSMPPLHILNIAILKDLKYRKRIGEISLHILSFMPASYEVLVDFRPFKKFGKWMYLFLRETQTHSHTRFSYHIMMYVYKITILGTKTQPRSCALKCVAHFLQTTEQARIFSTWFTRALSPCN